MKTIDNFHIYCHIPFCTNRCPFCYFMAKFNPKECFNLDLLDSYVNALCKEIYETNIPIDGLKSIIFGGGSPSLLKEHHIENILSTIKNKIADNTFKSVDNIGFELSPYNSTNEVVKYFHKSGFNRISIAVQSFVEEDLKTLGRYFPKEITNDFYKSARECGYDIINFDLLVAFPGHTIKNALTTLEETVNLKPDHISLNVFYSSYPGGKEFVEHCGRKNKSNLSIEEKIEMYNELCAFLYRSGYKRLTNTIFSLPNKTFAYDKALVSESEPVLSFGAGSAGFWENKVRYTPPEIGRYINKPFHLTETMSISKHAFQIVWGHLNTQYKIDEKILVDLFQNDFAQIMEKDKNISQLISTLITEKLGCFENNKFIIHEKNIDEAVILMHSIKDNWGYNIVTAPKQTNKQEILND